MYLFYMSNQDNLLHKIFFTSIGNSIATTIVPTAAAIGGATLGAALAQHGGLNLDGIKEGILDAAENGRHGRPSLLVLDRL